MPRVLFRNRSDPDNPDEAVPGIAELPREYVDTSEITPTGSTIVVNAGGNLQAAINAAVFGDQIVIEAGATFTGPFTLPNKTGTGWVIIRTATLDVNLPPFGTRMTPASAALLPKLVAPSPNPALITATGAHHYRFIGVEFALASGNNLDFSLISLGPDQTQLSEVPHHLIFDRVYAHGSSTAYLQRVFSMQSAHTAIINSYISDAHWVGADTQAIASWNGPGPFKIVNNYLEGAGENIMFGGADPSIPNLVPSDIEVRGNHFFKPLTWMVGHPSYAGLEWTVKNLFELKNAQRVLVDGNVLEHNWPHAQNGFSILFTVRNQDGSAPWSVVADVTFTNNIVRHVAGGFNTHGMDDIYPSQQTRRILIGNNLFEDVGVNWNGNGRLLQMSGLIDVVVNHNTLFSSDEFLNSSSDVPTLSLTYTNNLVVAGGTFIGGDGTYGNPALTLSTYFPGSVLTRNVLVGEDGGGYPSGNFFPATLAEVEFVNAAGGDYHLAPSSPYHNAAIDGTDIGLDVDALNAATAGAVSGTP